MKLSQCNEALLLLALSTNRDDAGRGGQTVGSDQDLDPGHDDNLLPTHAPEVIHPDN